MKSKEKVITPLRPKQIKQAGSTIVRPPKYFSKEKKNVSNNKMIKQTLLDKYKFQQIINPNRL